MPVCTDALLDEKRHNANYGVAPEEDLRLLKLKSENKFLHTSVILLTIAIASITLVEAFIAYYLNQAYRESDLLINNFGNDLPYPFLVVDHGTNLDNLHHLPIRMVYQLDKRGF